MARITDDRDTAQLSIVIAHPQGGDDRGHRVSLQIEDRASGLRLIDVEMNAEQFADLLATRFVRVDAKVPNVTHRDRLFKRHEFENVDVPGELGGKAEYDRDPQQIDDWAEEMRAAYGWEIATVVTGSQKFYARFERWADTPTKD